ncbi:GFA family protein [Paraglaciecola sp.]|uniref:GFA family protein n=1 Tax=Paraglaciecola sp. TaxID=1920173 RepID=UPI003EF70B65
MNIEHAKCNCGNVSVKVEFSKPISNFTPRVCDCDFCTQHGVAYVSDPKGKLSVQIRNHGQMVNQKQGNNLADFMICGMCRDLIAATYYNNGKLIASLNSGLLVNQQALLELTIVSPKHLMVSDKVKRWQQMWFQNVEVI